MDGAISISEPGLFVVTSAVIGNPLSSLALIEKATRAAGELLLFAADPALGARLHELVSILSAAAAKQNQEAQQIIEAAARYDAAVEVLTTDVWTRMHEMNGGLLLLKAQVEELRRGDEERGGEGWKNGE